MGSRFRQLSMTPQESEFFSQCNWFSQFCRQNGYLNSKLMLRWDSHFNMRPADSRADSGQPGGGGGSQPPSPGPRRCSGWLAPASSIDRQTVRGDTATAGAALPGRPVTNRPPASISGKQGGLRSGRAGPVGAHATGDLGAPTAHWPAKLHEHRMVGNRASHPLPTHIWY